MGSPSFASTCILSPAWYTLRDMTPPADIPTKEQLDQSWGPGNWVLCTDCGRNGGRAWHHVNYHNSLIKSTRRDRVAVIHE